MQQTLQDPIKAQILVIGNGMVGHHFIEQLRQRDAGCRVTVLCGEPQLAYDRVYLSSYFSGTPFAELSMSTQQWYAEHQVDLQLNCWVGRIDPSERLVYCQDGRVYAFDKLVLATGSYPFVPPIPGNDQPHCLVYRTLQDLQNIAASAAQSKVGVVIGGGLLGLEAANALKQLGLETHVRAEFAQQADGVSQDRWQPAAHY
ncbi:MAG: FAD-dependent oxidoreductase [Rheinheimera sp.]|nr:FAD-dependent oxidoreductase [Rheinheimera sp.]